MKSRQDFESEFDWFEYLRTYAATKAMQGILANHDWVKTLNIRYNWDEFKDRVTGASVEMADALIAELNKPKP